MAKTKPEKVYSGTGVYVGLVAVLVTLSALVILAAQNMTSSTSVFLRGSLNILWLPSFWPPLGSPLFWTKQQDSSGGDAAGASRLTVWS